MLKLDEEISLLRRARDGDTRAEATLMRSYEPLVRAAALRRHRSMARMSEARRPSYAIDLDDLVQAARYGLLRAIRKWQPGRRADGGDYGITPIAKLEVRNAMREAVRVAAPVMIVPGAPSSRNADINGAAIEEEIELRCEMGENRRAATKAACRAYGTGTSVYAGVSAARGAYLVTDGDDEYVAIESAADTAEEAVIQRQDADRIEALRRVLPDLLPELEHLELRAVQTMLKRPNVPPTLREAAASAVEKLRRMAGERHLLGI